MKYRVEVDDGNSCIVVQVEASSDDEALDKAEQEIPSNWGTTCYTVLGIKEE